MRACLTGEMLVPEIKNCSGNFCLIWLSQRWRRREVAKRHHRASIVADEIRIVKHAGPRSTTSCLSWATRTSCCPRNLPVWHLPRRVLLEIPYKARSSCTALLVVQIGSAHCYGLMGSCLLSLFCVWQRTGDFAAEVQRSWHLQLSDVSLRADVCGCFLGVCRQRVWRSLRSPAGDRPALQAARVIGFRVQAVQAACRCLGAKQ